MRNQPKYNFFKNTSYALKGLRDLITTETSFKRVSRKVEVFQNKSADLVMHHESFKNIQSLIKVTKTLTSPITGEVTITQQYLMANFKTTAKEFHQKILQHWRVETYHYHLDMLMEEDDHIAIFIINYIIRFFKLFYCRYSLLFKMFLIIFEFRYISITLVVYSI